MKKLSRTIISSVLCLSMFLSMGVFASAESSKKQVNLIGSGSSQTAKTGSVTVGNSLKERLDECITVYNNYQKVKSERKAKTPDSFTTVYTINGTIKQIDVLADCKVSKKSSSTSNYIVYDDFSVIYYYSDSGFPRFILATDKSGVKDKEYRFYVSQGEVIKWVDNDGEEYTTEPSNWHELYEVGLANYARAMYDCYDKGKYVVQVGCFTSLDEANECKDSMTALGEDVIVQQLDKAYCVVSRTYFTDYDSAADYGAEMNFSDECDVILVRLI